MQINNCSEQENDFIEKINTPENLWWNIIRNDKDFRIDLRRNAKATYPQINVYYSAGSYMRIKYTNKKFIADIHKQFLFGEGEGYCHCVLQGDSFTDENGTKHKLKEIKKTICSNITEFAKKHNKKERAFETNYSLDLNNNILITEYTGENKNNKERRLVENGKKINDIRVDMVRVNSDNILDFIELKLDENDEIKESYKKHKRNIVNQSEIYKNYHEKRQDIIRMLQKHYDMCKALKLPYAKYRPEKINPKITVMIACKNNDESFKENCLLNDEMVKKFVNIEVVNFEKYYK